MAEDQEFPNREKVCDCDICESCYFIVEFAEMLADPEKINEILKAMEVSEDSDNKKEKVVLALLIGATAEYAFRHGAHPEVVFDWLTIFWNKRSTLVLKSLQNMTSDQRAALRKRLEEYES